MSRYDYLVSRELDKQDFPFAALVMACMRRADTLNMFLLKATYPAIHEELISRYQAVGGRLPGDSAQEIQVDITLPNIRKDPTEDALARLVDRQMARIKQLEAELSRTRDEHHKFMKELNHVKLQMLKGKFR